MRTVTQESGSEQAPEIWHAMTAFLMVLEILGAGKGEVSPSSDCVKRRRWTD